MIKRVCLRIILMLLTIGLLSVHSFAEDEFIANNTPYSDFGAAYSVAIAASPSVITINTTVPLVIDPPLFISDDILIVGMDGDPESTVLKPSTGYSPIFVVTDNARVVFQGITVTGNTGVESTMGFTIGGGAVVTINHCIIAQQELGIELFDADVTIIESMIISGRSGIMHQSATSQNITILSSDISNHLENAIRIESNQVNLVIQENSIEGNGKTYSVEKDKYAIYIAGEPSGVTINNNNFDDNGPGDPGYFGLYSDASAVILAGNNWWGTTISGEIISSGNVDIEPILTAPLIFVENKFFIGQTGYPDWSSVMAAAGENDTIVISANTTIDENLNITVANITLSGADRDTVMVRGDTNASVPVIQISALNVTVSDLTVIEESSSDKIGINVQASDAVLDNVVVSGNRVGVFVESDVTIMNSRIQANREQGVLIQSDVQFTIAQNTIMGNGFAISGDVSTNYGIAVQGWESGSSIVTNNILSNGYNNGGIIATHNIYVGSQNTSSLNIQANYWGTAQVSEITAAFGGYPDYLVLSSIYDNPFDTDGTLISLTTRVFETVADGNWNSSSTWALSAVPAAQDDVRVVHAIFYNESNISAAINVRNIDIQSAGTLVLNNVTYPETHAVQLICDGTVTVNGTLEIRASANLKIKNSAALVVSDTGRLVLSGTDSAHASVIGVDASFNTDINGIFSAKHFTLNQFSGLNFGPSARVKSFAFGTIQNVASGQDVIQTQNPMLLSQITFDASGERYVNPGTSSPPMVWLLNCTPDNSKAPEQDANVVWVNSELIPEDTAFDLHLDHWGNATGLAFSDINQDGFVDVFVGASDAGHAALLKNENGVFTDITTEAGLDLDFDQNHALFGDYNSDGWPDLLIFSQNGIHLYENESSETQIQFTGRNSLLVNKLPLQSQQVFYTANWADIDQNGQLDLFIGGIEDYVFLQDDNSEFAVSTDEAFAVQNTSESTLDSLIFDINNDRILDLIKLRSNKMVQIYTQDETGSFTLETVELPVLGGSEYSVHSISAGDLNRDGFFDLVLGTSGSYAMVIMNSEDSYEVVHQEISGRYNKGIVLLDQDILMTNELESPLVDSLSTLAGVSSNGVLAEITGSIPFYGYHSRSLALSDLNADGAADFYVGNEFANSAFLNTPSATNKWFSVQVNGEGDSHPQAFGAKVKVRYNDKDHWQLITAANGNHSQNEPKAYFKLGAHHVQGVTVIFPSGKQYVSTDEIQVTTTQNIVVNESEAVDYFTISGEVKYDDGTAISEEAVVVEVKNTETHTVLSGTSQFSITVDVKMNPVVIRFVKGNAQTLERSGYIVDYTIQSFLDQDLGSVHLPKTTNILRGAVKHNSKSVPNVYVRVLPSLVQTELVIQKTGYAKTGLDGSFQVSVPQGAYYFQLVSGQSVGAPWLVGPEQLTNYNGEFNGENGLKEIGVIDIVNIVQDFEKPIIQVYGLADNENINGVYSLQGIIADNIALSSWRFQYRHNSNERWMRIKSGTSMVSGTIGSWDTTEQDDGYFELGIYALDSSGNDYTVVIPVNVRNITDDLYQYNFNSGVHLMSFPFVKSWSQVYGLNPEYVATYLNDGYQQQYAKLSEGQSYHQLRSMLPGRGYWIKVFNPQMIDLVGGGIASDQVPISLVPGWQLIGNPYYFDLRISQLTVRVNGDTYTISEAIQQGFLASYFWKWNDYRKEYTPIDAARSLEPWVGYWLHVLEPLELVFSKDARTYTYSAMNFLSAFQSQQISEDNWYAKLMLSSPDESLDKSNILGVQPDSTDEKDLTDAIEPPGSPYQIAGAHMYFPHVDYPSQAGFYNYAIDFKSKIDCAKEWDLDVNATQHEGDSLTIALESKYTIPENYVLKLYDNQNHVWADLSARESYTFKTPEKEYYTFKVKVLNLDESTEVLAISDVVVYPNPFNPNASQSVTLRVSLNKSATGTFYIYSKTGRRLYTEEIDNFAGDSLNTIIWNGQDEFGHVLANDVYIYYLDLQDSQGNKSTQKGKIVLWKK